jgi:hypothetical protein
MEASNEVEITEEIGMAASPEAMLNPERDVVHFVPVNLVARGLEQTFVITKEWLQSDVFFSSIWRDNPQQRPRVQSRIPPRVRAPSLSQASIGCSARRPDQDGLYRLRHYWIVWPP